MLNPGWVWALIGLILALPMPISKDSGLTDPASRCHQKLADLPGHYEYGLCTVNQPVTFDFEGQDTYAQLMQKGVEAAADLGNYRAAMSHFQQAIAIRDTINARRALKAAQTAQDACQHPDKYRGYYHAGLDPGYAVWVGMTGLRSKYD